MSNQVAAYSNKVAKQALLTASLLGLLAGTTGCGKDPKQIIENLVLGADIKTAVVDNEPRGEIRVLINNFGMRLPSFSAEIKDPRHPQDEFGVISLRDTFGGASELFLEVYINRLSAATEISDRLPNGRGIPVGGLGNTPVFSIPVNDTGVRIYTAFDRGVAMIGTAIPILELDSIGSKVGRLDVFPSFSFKDIRGIAGIFTGKERGQNGIGVFLDASKLVQQQNANVLAKSISTDGISESFAASMAYVNALEPSKLIFLEQRPRNKKVDKLYSEIYKLRKKNKRLHIH